MTYNFSTQPSNSTAVRTNHDLIQNEFGLNYYSDTIPMWVADMDFVCAPEIVAALKQRAEQATFGYSGFSNHYFKNLIHWFKSRHNMNFSEEEVVYSPGTVPAIRNIVRAFTHENEGVIIQPPVYYPFKMTIEECKRKLVENPLIMDEHNVYAINFVDFEKKCADPNNKLFIFCNPHNPVGQIWSAADTQRLMDICHKHEVLFLSDEVHGDIIRKGATFTSALNLNHYNNIIVATAVNKTFNLAGLHITNLIIPSGEVRKQLANFTGNLFISPFAEVAAVAAYGECAAWVDEMNSVIDLNFAFIKDFIAKHLPLIKFNLPAGTYLAWLDFRAYNIDEQLLIQKCANNARLILEGGSMFGEQGNGFVRMNIAASHNTIKEAFNRLHKMLA